MNKQTKDRLSHNARIANGYAGMISQIMDTGHVKSDFVEPQEPLRVDTEPQSKKELAEDHVYAEVMDEREREANDL